MNSRDVVHINGHEHILFTPQNYTERETAELSRSNFELMDKRRSIRSFSDRHVDRTVIENLIKTASTAPSGAHKQPWTFCAIADPDLKKRIRISAEAEEKDSYDRRMSQSWLKDLEPMGTDMYKPFLEIAPWLIVIFKKVYDIGEEQDTKRNYYVNESVGIATGMLITAIHQAGLVTLTHTPSPMQFLHTILDRPENERPYLLLPVGYPASPCYVPNIKRKELKDIAVFY